MPTDEFDYPAWVFTEKHEHLLHCVRYIRHVTGVNVFVRALPQVEPKPLSCGPAPKEK